MEQIFLCGKCEEVLKTYPDNHFDSIVTDPPYGISFMSKKWDYNVPSVDQWKEILRVLKPGGHALIACGTRTQHRMVVNIEDAGFEIRDVISWIYGSGFPKSLNISLAIDKQSGVIGHRGKAFRTAGAGDREDIQNKNGEGGMAYANPATDEAKKWDGWGTALKPSTEFFTLARKPISENTIAENVIKHGTGGLNIDGSRIEFKSDKDADSATWGRGTDIMGGNYVGAVHSSGKTNIKPNSGGRFPSNLILDEFMAKQMDLLTPKAGAFAPVQSGKPGLSNGIYGDFADKCDDGESFYGDSGGASRFFYCAKASREERNKGLEMFEKRQQDLSRKEGDRGGRTILGTGGGIKVSKYPSNC